MASHLLKVLAVLVVTSEPSFGQKRFRFPEYPLHNDSPRDTQSAETVDGSYSVVEPSSNQRDLPYITHMDSRLKTMLDTQPERTPIFQQIPEEPTNDQGSQPLSPQLTAPKLETAVTHDEYAPHRMAGVGHKLIGDQQSLQELSTRNNNAGNNTDQKLDLGKIEKITIEKPSRPISEKESTIVQDTVLPSVPDLPIQAKQESNKATMLPILLKPFYTILQKQDVKFDIPQLPVILNMQTNTDTFRLSQSPLQTELKLPRNDQTDLTKPPPSRDYINEQINCDDFQPQGTIESNNRALTNGEGKSLSPSRHLPMVGKSYEFAPSALPLVGGLPHDSARLQILSENPHHIFIHPPKVFPVTPSPELSGPLLGGPPIKPRATTTLATPSRLSQIYQGHKRPTSGRTLFFDSKPQQNLQTLQQQMYPVRTRLESLPDMQPVQYYLQPTPILNMQYPIPQQRNQEQMLLMMQRRFIRNYNNQELVPYMHPVAVLMVPSETTYPKTEQN